MTATDVRATAPLSRRRHRVHLAIVVALAILVETLTASTTIGRAAAIAVCLVLACRLPVDRAVLWFVAISLAAEERSNVPFGGLWTSPVQHVADFWFETVKKSVPFLPIPASPMFLIALGLLARVAVDRTGADLSRRTMNPLPASYRSAARAALVVLVASALYGAARGGNVQQTYYQLFGLVVVLCLAIAAARTGSPGMARSLCDIVVAIAVYRALLAVWMYVAVLPERVGPPPLYVTSHGDSVLWAVALVILFSRFIEEPRRRAAALLLSIGALLGFAMVVNNRRLAWVIVATALAYVVWVSQGPVRRRLARVGRVLAVPAALYVTAGLLGPQLRVFAPVQALRSVVQGGDSSSVTRDVENFNLVFTMRNNLPIGTGFGHQYVEVIRGDDITRTASSTFVNYRFLPHNSLLGLVMWMGPVGVALVLLPLLMGVAAALASHRESTDPVIRVYAAVVLTAWAGYVLEGWGDQGIYGGSSVVLAGVLAGVGMVLRSAPDGGAPAAVT